MIFLVSKGKTILGKLNFPSTPYSEILKRIDDFNTQIFEGFKLILLIDSDLIDDNWDFKSLDYHWVVLENPIQIKIAELAGKFLDQADIIREGFIF